MEGERDVEMCIKPLPPSNGRTLREMQYPPHLSLSQFTPASVFEYYNRFSRFPLQLKQKYDWTVKLDGKVCLSSPSNISRTATPIFPIFVLDRELLIISSPSIELNPTHAR